MLHGMYNYDAGATDLYQRIFPPWPIDDFEPDFSQLDDIYPNRNNMDWELEYRRLAHKLPLIVVGVRMPVFII